MAKMNPFEMFLKQVDEAMPYLNVEQEYIDILKEPKEVLEVAIPLKLDDGTVQIVKGWRAHHNNALGPYKGGVRYHPNVSREEVTALSAWMSIKCATAMLPYGGGKGGVRVSPHDLTKNELERLSRAYAMSIIRFTGTDIDVPAPDVYTDPQIMSWFIDTYEKIKGRSEPSCYTGKPVGLGGSLGRGDATSRGGMYVLREALREIGLLGKPLTAAIQGFGNVGSNAHKLFGEIGITVVAASDSKGGTYNPKGLDYAALSAHKKSGGTVADYPEGERITTDEILESQVDILIPAALEGVLTEANAGKVKAKTILELANGPTTPAAEQILHDNGAMVIPDVLANSGGVTVSCFEWIQGRSGDYWSEKTVHDKLDERLSMAFHEIWEIRKQHKIRMRQAAYVRAISRIVLAMRFRGIWP